MTDGEVSDLLTTFIPGLFSGRLSSSVLQYIGERREGGEVRGREERKKRRGGEGRGWGGE